MRRESKQGKITGGWRNKAGAVKENKDSRTRKEEPICNNSGEDVETVEYLFLFFFWATKHSRFGG
mgnify:CR=1 FL=1